MSGEAFVDTNVLLRAMIETAPLHVEAQTLLLTQRQQGMRLWVSRQVLREYLVQITRPQAFHLELSTEQIDNHMRRILLLFQVADETAEVTEKLLELLKKYPTGGKQIHDANIIATMLVYGIRLLISTNVDDMRRFESQIQILPLIHPPQ